MHVVRRRRRSGDRQLGAGAQVVALYVLTLWLPGLVLGGLAGLRGWTLAASAPCSPTPWPGCSGPCLRRGRASAWSPASAGRCVVGSAIAWPALVRCVELEPAGTRRSDPGDGAVAELDPPGEPLGVGRGRLRGARRARCRRDRCRASAGCRPMPQDWDAAFHANGIRWIAETGDSSLVGDGQRQLVRERRPDLLPQRLSPGRRGRAATHRRGRPDGPQRAHPAAARYGRAGHRRAGAPVRRTGGARGRRCRVHACRSRRSTTCSGAARCCRTSPASC